MTQYNDTIATKALAAFKGRPRTTQEVARQVNLPVRTMGLHLSRMADAGAVIKAEQVYGYQLWEPVP